MLSCLSTHDLSPTTALLSWLTYSFSLTEKLKQEQGDASLELIKQHWTAPNWWERFVLGLSGEPVLHRDICMSAYQNPCWYARTMVPEQCYLKNEFFFSRLGNNALGSLLFHEPTIKRVQLFHYPIDSHCLEYHWFPELNNILFWVRLSAFNMNDSCFFLVELFLPSLLNLNT